MPQVIARLRRDESGAALVEFAITLPVLLLMGLGGLELAHFGYASLRVSQIAQTVADNAGRVRNQITDGDINEVMTGAKFAGNGIKFATYGRIILSSLEPRTDDPTKQWIRWQRCYGLKNVASTYGVPKTAAGATISDATESYNSGGSLSATTAQSDQTKSIPSDGTNPTPDAMGPPGKQIKAAGGTALMFVEIVYEYQPVVGTRWISEQEIRAVRAFNVRQRTDQVVKTGSVSYADRSRCNKFTDT